ncbi:MAG: hypothetical protein QM811_14100 [Pirellulales bacterium]
MHGDPIQRGGHCALVLFGRARSSDLNTFSTKSKQVFITARSRTDPGSFSGLPEDSTHGGTGAVRVEEIRRQSRQCLIVRSGLRPTSGRNELVRFVVFLSDQRWRIQIGIHCLLDVDGQRFVEFRT